MFLIKNNFIAKTVFFVISWDNKNILKVSISLITSVLLLIYQLKIVTAD
jgi:hypothetical protein